MIEEEYNFDDIKSYLYDNIDLLITCEPTEEDRSCFFFNLWKSRNAQILTFQYLVLDDQERLICRYYGADYSHPYKVIVGLDMSLNNYLNDVVKIKEKRILVDITCLNHTIIMVLTKALINYSKPKEWFASYIRPISYLTSEKDTDLELSKKINNVRCVPTFVKRENEHQTLCAFIGFEGIRLKNIIENTYNIDAFKPIVAFPSGTPQWFNNTMWNSMYLLQQYDDIIVNQCLSESVFEAYRLLCKLLENDQNVIIAPLGTRPHSMASAIYATKHKKARIIYDFVEEIENRTEGIDYINIYHLSSFISNEA